MLVPVGISLTTLTSMKETFQQPTIPADDVTVLMKVNTFKYHVIAPMGRFLLELMYLYFSPFFHQTVSCFCPVGLSFL